MTDTYILNMHSPRHRKVSSEENPNKSKEDSRSSLSSDEERMNFLKTLYFIMAVLSIFLSLFSYYTWKHTKSHSILVLSLVSALSTVSAFCGIFGSFRGIKDLKFRHLILAGEKEGVGKNLLMLSFFLMLISMTLYLVFGSHALFYSERSLAYLEAFYHSNSSGADLANEASLLNVEKWSLLLITISGYTAYLIIIVMILITYFAYLLSLLYDSIDRMFEIVNLNIMNLGLGMIYITVYCIEYHSNLKFIAVIPQHIPYAIIVVGILLCLSCVISFFVVRLQNISHLKLYLTLNFFMIIICGLCATISVRSTHLFREGLSEKCFDFMAIVSNDYLKTLGCEDKYVNTTNVEENQCAKGQNRLIWEKNLENDDSYGCLNPYCCDVLVTDAKTKFDYLGICAGSAIGLICISLWACYYIWNKFKSGQLAHRHKVDLKIVFWVVFTPLITIFSVFYLIPTTPYLISYLETSTYVSSPAVVDSRLVALDWCYSSIDFSNFTIEKCSNCLKNEFLVLVNGKNGHVKTSEFISSEPGKVLDYLAKLEFCPVCPNLVHFWDVSLIRRDYEENQIIDVELGSVKIRAEESEKIRLRGKTNPDFGVEIHSESSCLDFYSEVSPYEISSGLPPYSLPMAVKLHYSANGSLPTTRLVQLGGLPLYPYYIQPSLLLAPASNSIRYTFQAVSTRGGQINKFSIELRTGYNNYTGPCDSYNFTGNEGVLSLEKAVYSVLGLAENFKNDYSETLESKVINLLFTPDDFEENEIRITLSWTGDIDLDLRSSFALNEKFDCELNFANKICGSARISASSVSGSSGEEITLKKVLPYHYLFYVKEYKAEKVRLVDALASLKVYVKNYKFPIVRLYEQQEYTYNVTEDEYKVWLGFCMDGRRGVMSVAPLQAFVSINSMKNAKEVCREFYGDQEWTTGKVDTSSQLTLPSINY